MIGTAFGGKVTERDKARFDSTLYIIIFDHNLQACHADNHLDQAMKEE
jgi:hypothetical protein